MNILKNLVIGIPVLIAGCMYLFATIGLFGIAIAYITLGITGITVLIISGYFVGEVIRTWR